MEVWPETLPQRWLRNGLSVQESDNVIRSQVDRGPALTRRRSLVTIERYSGSMRMTHAQYATLQDFYKNTVKSVLPFTMPHPFNEEETVEATFLQPPGRSYFSPGAYKVDLVIEVILP